MKKQNNGRELTLKVRKKIKYSSSEITLFSSGQLSANLILISAQETQLDTHLRKNVIDQSSIMLLKASELIGLSVRSKLKKYI